MKNIDLHTHSQYSDGTLPPADVVRQAKKRGVEVMALTDHDSVSGFAEAQAAANESGMKLLCGVEINTREHDQLHILGYGLDVDSAALKARLEEFRGRRHRRILMIIQKLRDAKVDIAFEDIQGVSKQALGRPHVADAMIRKKIVRSRKEAFDRFLMRGRPGYVDPMGPTPEEAISAIREAGGWSSLAHPGTIEVDGRIEKLVELGLNGIEAFYPTHSNPMVGKLLDLAARFNLTATGGSDYHGPGTGRELIGDVSISDDARRKLLDRLGVGV